MQQLRYKTTIIGSKGKASRSPYTASILNNYLFTGTMCFSGDALSARPYRWPIKRFRDIIHVGLNTLSRVYKGSETTLSIKESMWFISRFDSLTTTKTIDMKKNIILTAKIIPVVLIMWVITSILQTHG